MNVIEMIKRSLRRFLMRRVLKSASRQRRMVDYASSGTIALLYGHDHDEDVGVAGKLIKQFQEDGKSVSALGFVNAGVVPEETTPPKHTRICCRKDFSWLLKPKRAFLKEFTSTKFDILIDLSPYQAHPMKFMAARSEAIFKTGAAHPDTDGVYDLIMQVEEDCPAAELARHIIHYLKIIKTRNTNA
ncbi:MAG: DUF6913 domain-containing protein [Bacteroidales bacterium]